MKTTEIVCAAIKRIAPDIDTATLPPDCDYREECELDSIDFLGVLSVVHETTGIEIAETDYDQIRTINSFAEYLTRKQRDLPRLDAPVVN